ncbi:MAG: hypothetical protein ACRCYY_21415 [Trueperaceae bacterium]
MASLENLNLEQRLVFLRDMSLLGQAVFDECNPLRMNYSIYGNHDHFLHAHVRARYGWETDERRKAPYDRYPAEERNSPEVSIETGKYEELRLKIQKRFVALTNPCRRTPHTSCVTLSI